MGMFKYIRATLYKVKDRHIRPWFDFPDSTSNGYIAKRTPNSHATDTGSENLVVLPFS
jgi:hypothetical protein